MVSNDEPPACLRLPESGYEDAGPAAVVVCEGNVGLHCGLLHRRDDEPPSVLHLAFHHDLRDEPMSKDWTWVVSGVDQDRLEHVAAWCRLVINANARDEVPYAFFFDETAIHDDGKIVIGAEERGLTCATFVLALFRRVRIELIALDTWETRLDDIEVQKKLVAYLQRQDPVHATRVEREVGCMRVRSEEVAAASAQVAHPVAFALAAPLGARIVAAVLRR